MPFTGDDATPSLWEGMEIPPPAAPEEDRPLPELPPALLEAPHTLESALAEPPRECPHCEEPVTRESDVGAAPDSLAGAFTREWLSVQQHTARAWRAAAAMHAHVRAERGPAAAEHVGADLALLTNLHPRSGEALMITSLQAAREVPELAELVECGQLSAKHVDALLDEVGRWTETAEQAGAVLRLTLDRCRERAAEYGWPTPAQLRRRLRTAALLLDMSAAEKRKRSVAERRGVALLQSGAGQGSLSIEGPDRMLVQAYEAIRARAEALGQLPGDTRTREQREFDAALDLLPVDADGGDSARPATGHEGEPVPLVVRGIEVSLVMPYSIAQGGNHELAEVPGFGPILPSTARELLNQARSVRRVAVDAGTGEVLAVDDKMRTPQPPPEEDPGDHGGSGGTPHPPPDLPPSPPSGSARSEPVGEADDVAVRPDIRVLLQRTAGWLVTRQDLHTSQYRVPGRLRRFLQLRDRSCTFPGCHVPGRYCDIDHREEWPRGGTHDVNCHCLCRRHHRAKQAYFTVTLDPGNGDTCWTTPDERTYRRPPPRF